MSEIKKGDRFNWHGIRVLVTRVSADPYQPWADLRCWGPAGAPWTKRMPLPLPEDFRPVTT